MIFGTFAACMCKNIIGSVDILFIAICRVCFLPIAILSSLVAVVYIELYGFKFNQAI